MYGTHKLTTAEVIAAWSDEQRNEAEKTSAITAETLSNGLVIQSITTRRGGETITVATVTVCKNGTKYDVVPDYPIHCPWVLCSAGKASLICRDYLLSMYLFAQRYLGTSET